MIVTLEEMKQYLRVDYEDDDQLITDFITSAEQLCRDVLRVDGEADLSGDGKVKPQPCMRLRIYMNTGRKRITMI